MGRLKNREFWQAALARSVWTMAEVFIALVGTSGVTEIDWDYVLVSTAFAGALSLAKSIVKGLPEVET